MRRTTRRHLRDLLFRQVQAASEEAIRADGQISDEQVQALERLARLAALCDEAQPPPYRKRWPVAATLGSTLLIVSLLLFARVPKTEIELDLVLSGVSFVLPTQQVLTNGMDLSAIGVFGLQEIRLPHIPNRESRTRPEDTDSAIRLAIASDGERQGTVTLTALTLPAETHVRLHDTAISRQYRLFLGATGLVLRVAIDGPVRVDLADAPAQSVDFTSPKSVFLYPGSNEVQMDLMLPTAAPGTFSPQLAARDLSLFRIEEIADLDRTVVRHMSTILSGTLYLESLNGKKRSLRPGEVLRFEDVRGEIRTLRLQEDHIILKFHGHVRGMSTGSEKPHRSLMPTLLEWLRARHGLSLLWGTTLYLLGLVLGAFRWWREEL